MATRLYVISQFHWAGFRPAASSYWDDVPASIPRIPLEIGAVRGAGGTQTWGNTKTLAGPRNMLIVQFLLPQLAAQTISGTVKGQFLMNESVGTMDAGVQCSMKLWRPSTQDYVGTLLANNNYGAISATPGAVGYELATTLTNRKIPSGWSGSGASLTSQDAQDYDCLVIDVGVRYFEGAASRTAQVRGLQNAGTDLAEDETTTTSNNPWFEFSNDITQNQKAMVRRSNVVSPWGRLKAGQLWPRGSRGR